MIPNVKEGVQRVKVGMQKAAVSRFLVPVAFGVSTYLGIHDFAHMNMLDSVQVAGGAALFTSSVAEGMYRGRPSSLTLPLLTGLVAMGGSLYAHHNEYITPAYFVTGGLTFAGEKIIANSFSTRKSSARRG